MPDDVYVERQGHQPRSARYGSALTRPNAVIRASALLRRHGPVKPHHATPWNEPILDSFSARRATSFTRQPVVFLQGGSGQRFWLASTLNLKVAFEYELSRIFCSVPQPPSLLINCWRVCVVMPAAESERFPRS